MRAAVYETAGPAAEVLRLIDVEAPEPGSGEVRVRVVRHGVNPTDVKRRAGARGPLPFPRMIPGYDASGEIDAVGEGVDRARVGERVWVWEAAHRRWDGAAAEMTCVPASRAMPLPAPLSWDQGAALGVPAITAAPSLRLARPLGDDWALVIGGAGAVGAAAVALAKHMGARVIATVRDRERIADAEAAGADVVVAPEHDRIEEAVKDCTGGAGVRCMVDVDLGAHLSRSWRWVAQNGTIASFGSASDPAPPLDWAKFMYRNIALRGVAIFEVPEPDKRAAAASVQDALEAGRLSPVIDVALPLDRIVEAHERQESGRPRGTICVDPTR
ncbi:MAG: NADPH:quinone reductase [Pseudomonadota bacterium]